MVVDHVRRIGFKLFIKNENDNDRIIQTAAAVILIEFVLFHMTRCSTGEYSSTLVVTTGCVPLPSSVANGYLAGFRQEN